MSERASSFVRINCFFFVDLGMARAAIAKMLSTERRFIIARVDNDRNDNNKFLSREREKERKKEREREKVVQAFEKKNIIHSFGGGITPFVIKKQP